MQAAQFVEQLELNNEALFRASELQVKSYFDSKPSKAELIDHFKGRMVNERMNMVEISAQIAAAPADADTTELNLLAKQAQDEAKHFRMVKNVIEHLSGEPCDVGAAVDVESDVEKGSASRLSVSEACLPWRFIRVVVVLM
jgi:hypothetical protein